MSFVVVIGLYMLVNYVKNVGMGSMEVILFKVGGSGKCCVLGDVYFVNKCFKFDDVVISFSDFLFVLLMFWIKCKLCWWCWLVFKWIGF